jgi:hypothetical protein
MIIEISAIGTASSAFDALTSSKLAHKKLFLEMFSVSESSTSLRAEISV